MFEHFNTLFSGAAAPNPHDVAQAIKTLIATPKGQRPARTIVGAAYGSDVVNEAVAPVQADAVDALRLGHLSSVAMG